MNNEPYVEIISRELTRDVDGTSAENKVVSRFYLSEVKSFRDGPVMVSVVTTDGKYYGWTYNYLETIYFPDVEKFKDVLR